MSEPFRFSGYVYRGNVKYTHYALNKTTIYSKSRNHLGDQIESFRTGDKDNKREDDLLDTFCHGIALALGDGSGFYRASPLSTDKPTSPTMDVSSALCQQPTFVSICISHPAARARPDEEAQFHIAE